MSLLWEHRNQLDGLRPLVEIAHWTVISHVPPEDLDDVEQDIVIHLWRTVKKYGKKVGIDLGNLDLRGRNYLNKAARNRRSAYFHKRAQEIKEKEFCNIGDSFKDTQVVSHDNNPEARLDALAILATLPERLIQIGHKLLDGEKLCEADQHYRINQKRKLRPTLHCRRYAIHLSDGEERRILHLHSEGVSMCKIARTMERSNHAVMRVLADHQPLTRQNWLAKKEMERNEKAVRIRHAYFEDGKSILRIAREFHIGRLTVRRSIRSAGIV